MTDELAQAYMVCICCIGPLTILDFWRTSQRVRQVGLGIGLNTTGDPPNFVLVPKVEDRMMYANCGGNAFFFQRLKAMDATQW